MDPNDGEKKTGSFRAGWSSLLEREGESQALDSFRPASKKERRSALIDLGGQGRKESNPHLRFWRPLFYQ